MAEFFRSTALPHLEARRSCQKNSCYRPHTHDTFSIGLIDAGESVFSGPLGGSVDLHPDDVILIPAGHVHQCNPHSGNWRYQMIHMSQEWVLGLVGHRAAENLISAITVLRRPGLHRRVSAWVEYVVADEGAERIEAGFRGLECDLAESLPTYRVVQVNDPDLSHQLLPVMKRLQEDATNPRLDELADEIGMTKYQLVRAVKRTTGLAPLAWRQNARIEQARHMLRDGRPIADTAHTLGFTDQSHFHRVFRAHVAAAPGAYRS